MEILVSLNNERHEAIRDAAYNFLDALPGFPGDMNNDQAQEQVAVFAECMIIFAERNRRYGDSWKRYGWMDNLFHMRSKFLRITKAYWEGTRSMGPGFSENSDNLDDAYDLLNYGAFFIRNVQANNERGTDG